MLGEKAVLSHKSLSNIHAKGLQTLPMKFPRYFSQISFAFVNLDTGLAGVWVKKCHLYVKDVRTVEVVESVKIVQVVSQKREKKLEDYLSPVPLRGTRATELSEII